MYRGWTNENIICLKHHLSIYPSWSVISIHNMLQWQNIFYQGFHKNTYSFLRHCCFFLSFHKIWWETEPLKIKTVPQTYFEKFCLLYITFLVSVISRFGNNHPQKSKIYSKPSGITETKPYNCNVVVFLPIKRS